MGVNYENQADMKRLETTLRGIIYMIKDLTASPPIDTDMDTLVRTVAREISKPLSGGSFDSIIAMYIFGTFRRH